MLWFERYIKNGGVERKTNEKYLWRNMILSLRVRYIKKSILSSSKYADCQPGRDLCAPFPEKLDRWFNENVSCNILKVQRPIISTCSVGKLGFPQYLRQALKLLTITPREIRRIKEND